MVKLSIVGLEKKVMPIGWSLNVVYMPFDFGYEVQYSVADDKGLVRYMSKTKVYCQKDECLVRIWLKVLIEVIENLPDEFSALYIIEPSNSFLAVCQAGKLFDDKGKPNSVQYFIIE